MSDRDLRVRNARIVTANAVVDGTLSVRAGAIEAVEPGSASAKGNGHDGGSADWDGDYLLPGLVELHTDNVERHLLPRPGVKWPRTEAILAHDAEIAAAGITTVLDALRIGAWENETSIADYVDDLIAAIDEAADAGVFRAEHLIHFRCELGCDGTAEQMEGLADHPRTRLVSVMDHTPGQRQFTSFAKFEEYYGGKYNLAGEAMERFIRLRIEQQERNSARNRDAIVSLCHDRGLALASHDDATDDHVAEAVDDGMVIAEFPTSVPAARSATDAGLAVLMGAPNVVRGGSHSGNVSALELAERGLLNILSSDYVPSSLLSAAFRVAEAVPQIDLPEAVACVTKHPADAIGLTDRGEIAVGKRADLVRVGIVEGTPVVRAVWREGRRVL